MARIIPSSLISGIIGRFNGDTFQSWGPAVIRRRQGSPSRRNSAASASFRGITSDLAGRWSSLSAQDRASWNAYAAMLPSLMSGFNAFIARNSVCLQAAHSGLCYFTSAPLSPFIPPVPSGLSVSWAPSSSEFLIQWSSPLLSCLYVQSFLAAQICFSPGKNPPVVFARTESAPSGGMSVCGARFPAGLFLLFRLRCVDVFGRFSGFSPVIRVQRG